ncbi:MAG: hypothetical protein VX000_02880 [Myxococcota bacterium]|nr:hypothetical protein [Myxococcota bacterium]
MRSLSFALLYTATLSVCIGAVESLKAHWDVMEPPPTPQEIEQVAIAVPPRPEGQREVKGAGDEGYRYTEQGCRELDGELRDICFQQLAAQRAGTDLSGGLAACNLIGDVDKRGECMASAAEVHAVVDRDASLTVCETIEKGKWRDQCVFGIALALSTVDSAYAFRLCSEAGRWLDFCRHDVNGEIAQVDPQLAYDHCAAEEGDLLRRKSCWHGIGKYMGRVDMAAAWEWCARVPAGPEDLYLENCIHGLSWAGAERFGREFVRECERAGEKKDSCLLGIAYNLKRFDPAAGVALCETVQRADLQEKCLAHVAR